MIHIIRPTATTLALVEYDYARKSEADYVGEVITWALPDAEFWAWLDHRPDARPYLRSMQKDNPSRLKRARAFIGVLRNEKACITTAGLARASLVSQRPAGRVLIAAIAAVRER